MDLSSSGFPSFIGRSRVFFFLFSVLFAFCTGTSGISKNKGLETKSKAQMNARKPKMRGEGKKHKEEKEQKTHNQTQGAKRRGAREVKEKQ